MPRGGSADGSMRPMKTGTPFGKRSNRAVNKKFHPIFRRDVEIINHGQRPGYEEGPSEGAGDIGKAPLGPLKVHLT